MPEVADSCECHGQPGVVGGLDDFVVANRSAGLNDGGGARFGDRKQSVSETERKHQMPRRNLWLTAPASQQLRRPRAP